MERLDDDQFEEATNELEEISVDFVENWGVSTDEFNGMLLAQIARYYIHNQEYQGIKKLLTDVIASIDDIEQQEERDVMKVIKDINSLDNDEGEQ
tara:strand:+ start:1110 stop:1394 length:285 start_codon:yes stop_codon:yes gene_type:complete